MRFGTPSAATLDRFRENTANATPISLRRKHCACGKIVTSKQLAQQGGCNACARRAAAERKAA